MPAKKTEVLAVGDKLQVKFGQVTANYMKRINKLQAELDAKLSILESAKLADEKGELTADEYVRVMAL